MLVLGGFCVRTALHLSLDARALDSQWVTFAASKPAQKRRAPADAGPVAAHPPLCPRRNFPLRCVLKRREYNKTRPTPGTRKRVGRGSWERQGCHLPLPSSTTSKGAGRSAWTNFDPRVGRWVERVPPPRRRGSRAAGTESQAPPATAARERQSRGMSIGGLGRNRMARPSGK